MSHHPSIPVETGFDDERKAMLGIFAQELDETVQGLESTIIELESHPNNQDIINHTFRLFHNLKGASATVGFGTITDLAHYSESLLSIFRASEKSVNAEIVDVLLEVINALRSIGEEIRRTGDQGDNRYFKLLQRLVETVKQHEGDGTEEQKTKTDTKANKSSPKNQAGESEQIRVSRELIDQVMLLVSEFMLLKNRINWLQGRYRQDRDFYDNVQELEHFSVKLQRTVLKLRLSPVAPLMNAMKRVVRSTAKQTGKQVELEISGTDTLLDRSILDKLAEPMMHMIRNAIDHGIESRDVRLQNNKPETGHIQLKAYYRTGEVHIMINDDGGGIDPQRIRRKAIEKGLINQAQAEAMNPTDLMQIIFMPGFSSTDTISEISGRGVGLDVVKSTVEELGGHVDIQSEVGAGTNFILRLPLSLAIIQSLGFVVGDQAYAVPQANVEEVLSYSSQMVQDNLKRLESGAEVLVVRGTSFPILHFEKVVGKAVDDLTGLIQLRHGAHRFFITVGKVLGPMSIVTQPLPEVFEDKAPFSGVTKQGDGSLLFQVDVSRLAKMLDATVTVTKKKSSFNRGLAGIQQEGSFLTSSDMRRLQQKVIAFRCGLAFCIPVQRAKRIVFVGKSDIETLGASGQSYITLDGETIPLIWIEEILLRKTRIEKDEYSLLIFHHEDHHYAIPMAEFLGIERMPEAYATEIREPGILGSTVIHDETHLLLDLANIIRLSRKETVVQKPLGKKVETILVAEDDKFFATEIEASLKARGYQVILCKDGLEAKEYLSSPEHVQSIDCCVLDIEMPRLNGLGLCRWIKGHVATEHLPVIAYTAIVTHEMREKMYSAGVVGYVSKMSFDELYRVLAQVLGNEHHNLRQEQTARQHHSDRLLTFSVGQDTFALPMEFIKEVSPTVPTADVPDQPAYLNEVTTFRGNIIPILDLWTYFRMPNDGKEREQAVIEVEGHTFAIRVGRVGEVYLKSKLVHGYGMARTGGEDSLIIDLISEVFMLGERVISLVNPYKLIKVCGLLNQESSDKGVAA